MDGYSCREEFKVCAVSLGLFCTVFVLLARFSTHLGVRDLLAATLFLHSSASRAVRSKGHSFYLSSLKYSVAVIPNRQRQVSRRENKWHEVPPGEERWSLQNKRHTDIQPSIEPNGIDTRRYCLGIHSGTNRGICETVRTNAPYMQWSCSYLQVCTAVSAPNYISAKHSYLVALCSQIFIDRITTSRICFEIML